LKSDCVVVNIVENSFCNERCNMALNLNKYQKEAVTHLDGPCLVTSCPGSGKTFTLVERIVCLIKRGVKPKNILCLTFTNKAANEMKERVCKRLGVDKVDFFIGTFHSLCARMLRKIGPSHGHKVNFSIIDDKDQIDLIMQISRKLEIEISKPDAFKIANRLNFYRDGMEDFSWFESEVNLESYVDIGTEYIKHCKRNSLFDFSALIYETIKMIEGDDDLKRKVQNTFKYIMVDETQDTNKSQFHLVNLLGGRWRNIMLIGDIDQSIYGWRGARYQNIQDFINNYQDCKVISLSKNYRSTPQIVGHASRLIKLNTSHMGTAFETDNNDGEKVKCFSFNDQYAEAHWVGRTAKKFIEEGGWDPSDMAVLYRANKMSEPIEQALVKNSIPYEVVGAWNFYDRKEVRDCLAMLKLLANPRDGIAFGRVCNFVDGMGAVTVGRIENLAQEKDITIPQACKIMGEKVSSIKISRGCEKLSNIYNKKWDHTNPASCMSQLINGFNYENYLNRKFDNTANERKDNISQIVSSAGECSGEENGVSKYLQQVSLVTNAEKEDKEDKMPLMSLHAAKGLEFPIVFMIGTEEDLLPHKNAMSEDPYAGLEEERRLCYVGMTRAKKVLFMSWCQKRKKFGKYGNQTFNRCKPSRFLYESGVLKKGQYGR
jgi:DNA helicase-2/ATP-dependent DNA helicase PcrA